MQVLKKYVLNDLIIYFIIVKYYQVYSRRDLIPTTQNLVFLLSWSISLLFLVQWLTNVNQSCITFKTFILSICYHLYYYLLTIFHYTYIFHILTFPLLMFLKNLLPDRHLLCHYAAWTLGVSISFGFMLDSRIPIVQILFYKALFTHFLPPGFPPNETFLQTTCYVEPKDTTDESGIVPIIGAMVAFQAAFKVTPETRGLWRRQLNSCCTIAFAENIHTHYISAEALTLCSDSINLRM